MVGINPTRRGTELAADIRGTDCAVIVTDDAYGDLLDGIDHGSQILDSGSSEYAGLLAMHHGAAVQATPLGLDPRTTLLLLFTSGSTGAPKAVICSTGRWAFICQVSPIKFSCDDVAYNAMPIFHGNALMSALGPCLANGQRSICAGGSRRPASCPTSASSVRPSSITSAGRWPTWLPSRSAKGSPTTSCASASVPRHRPATALSSPGGMAARFLSPTDPQRARATSSTRPAPQRARSESRSKDSW